MCAWAPLQKFYSLNAKSFLFIHIEIFLLFSQNILVFGSAIGHAAEAEPYSNILEIL
jgi:hypothetical protein